MAESDSSVVTGSGEAATPPKLIDAWYVVSDLHLGEGRTIEVRLKYRWQYRIRRWFYGFFAMIAGWLGRNVSHLAPARTVEIPNPLEDFPFDAEFADFIAKIIAKHGQAETVGLKLMGDCFDPLAVTVAGRLGGRATAGVCAYKMKKIIAGHKAFFDALEAFLELPNARLVIFVGNHDSFINWPSVQRVIARRLSRGNEAKLGRIRFVDYRDGYCQVEDDVIFNHGMNAERHTSLDAEKPFITERFGRKLRLPELNEPIGNLMAAEISNVIKIGNSHISRLNDKHAWREAKLKLRIGWALGAGFTLISFAVRHSALGLRNILQVVKATTEDDPVDEYGKRLLRESEPKPRAVVMGHNHNASRETIPGVGTYANTGTWTGRRRLVWPEVSYQWKRFRWVEEGWRAFLHYLYAAKSPLGRRVTVFVLYLFVVGGLMTFLQTSFAGVAAYAIYGLKTLVGVMLAFILLKGLAHFFMVQPEVEEYHLFSCVLKRRYDNGTLLVDLMLYDHENGTIREYV